MIATELKLEHFVYIAISKSTIKENRICFNNNNNNSLSLAVGLAVVAVEIKKHIIKLKNKN